MLPPIANGDDAVSSTGQDPFCSSHDLLLSTKVTDFKGTPAVGGQSLTGLGLLLARSSDL